jgi:hypothetical protein
MTEQINPLYVCTLWYKPRKTMQGLIENGRGHRTSLIVAIASGMIQAVPVYSSDESLGVSVFLIGAIIGFLGLYLLAWLLRNFGRWFGAQASLREVRTGLGLGLMPWLLCFSVLFLFRQNFGSFRGRSVFLAVLYPFSLWLHSCHTLTHRGPSTDAFEDFPLLSINDYF